MKNIKLKDIEKKLFHLRLVLQCTVCRGIPEETK